MPQCELTCHPQSPCDAVKRIEVDVAVGAERIFNLRFRIRGDIDRLVVPLVQAPRRQDGLWRHTCAEVFVGTLVAAGYHEFNFSPSIQWAAYWFESYREGMIDADVSAPQMTIQRTQDALELNVAINLQTSIALSERSRCALACVIEEQSGGLSFWALQHAPGDKPDFHHPSGFVFAPIQDS